MIQGINFIGYLKNGSGIHIKKKNRGKFTASAKRAGKSVQEYAKSVLNDPNATPLQRKRANFARNSKKWKHQEGGILQTATGLTPIYGHKSILDNGWFPKNRLNKITSNLSIYG